MYYLTAQDIQERLIRMVGGRASPETVIDIRQAIRQALRTVSASHNWPYYHDYLHLTTNATYTTGMITYTASNRTAILAGGTYPTWANQGVLIVDGKHARIVTRNSGTSVVLDSDDAPSSNYTGSYTLYQYQFTLPTNDNIYRVGKLQVDQSNWIEYIPPAFFETEARYRYMTTGGRPRWFTISRDRLNTGQKVLSLWPYPTTELRIRMGYIRHPRDILVWDYQNGQVETDSGSTSVIGTNTAFSSIHEGAVIRTYSDRTNIPTGYDGAYPPVDEAVIDEVLDATHLDTKASLTTTQEDVSFTISDLVDVDNTILYDVVSQCARLEFCKLQRINPKLQAMYELDYQKALYLAKASSNSSGSVGVAGSFRNSAIGFPGLWDDYYVLA